MITLEKVKVAYDEVVVEDISFTLSGEKVVVLLGENGCGKTTLMKALAGILPYEGTIKANGNDVKLMQGNKRSQVFGYVPQIKTTIDHIPIMNFLCSGAVSHFGLFEIPNQILEKQVLEVLKAFGCMHLKDAYLDEMSGGELQLVYVMRCVMQSPMCYLLDEPTTYLDYRHQHQFFHQITKLKKQGASVLVSVHDPNLAMQYGDVIAMMKDGKIENWIDLHEADAIKQFYEFYHRWYPQVQLCGEKDERYIVWKGEKSC